MTGVEDLFDGIVFLFLFDAGQDKGTPGETCLFWVRKRGRSYVKLQQCYILIIFEDINRKDV